MAQQNLTTITRDHHLRNAEHARSEAGPSLATRMLLEAHPERAADLARIDELVLQHHADLCRRLEAAQELDSLGAELSRGYASSLARQRLASVAARLRGAL